MQLTKAACSLKSLFAAYHKPPLLSKQQSQRVLDGLKSSFRNNLDREYGLGPTPRTAAGAATAVKEQTTSPEDRNQVHRRPAANQHLKQLLSNPLFSYQLKPVADGSPTASKAERDPMNVFDHAVSKGMMTLKAATGCLIAKRQQLQKEADRPSPDSNVASRLISWLKWSYPNGDSAFLDDRQFIQALMPFVILEKSERVIWAWMSRIMRVPAIPSANRLWRASNLLTELVKVQSQPQYGDLDAAITSLLKAERQFDTNPLLPEILFRSWRSISWLSTVVSYSHEAASERLFDAHMAAADRLMRNVELEKAHLHLCHPTHPNHTPALEFFQNSLDSIRSFVDRLSPEELGQAKTKDMGTIPWAAVLAHDTMNYLLKSGRSQEAEDMNELLQTELPALFSHTPKME